MGSHEARASTEGKRGGVMSDLHTLLVGILGGIIAYYATKGIDRCLIRRTIRGRQRQITQLSQELQLLEKIGVTDRALLLWALGLLFALIGVAAVGVAGSVAPSWLSGPPDNGIRTILLLVSVVIAMLALYASSIFRRLEDPEPTLERLRWKLRELQGLDDQNPAKRGGA